MRENVQKFGKFLSGMVMPNIGAFIAWGFITALFISAGWLPNERLATLVDPMLKYLLPVLIGLTGGKMVGGDRGAVIASIATIGVVVGSDVTMFIGAMIIGPLAGLVIKKFDQAMEGRMPAGMEMLINNFSVGILGMILAIIGYYAVGPFITAILTVLTAGVDVIVAKGLLPLVAIFIEPAKVLFLNNAINHGIFSPIGAEQVKIAGQSVMYLLEANPGPGLGVLLAYCLFSKGNAKNSAPGAAFIHLIGGIHEIYFPYILMNPVVIIAPICGNIAAIFFYNLMHAGLVGPASPGSLIAFLAMSPKGEQLIVFAGVAIAAAVSFVIASPIVKRAASHGAVDLDAAKEQMKSMKVSVNKDTISKIVFACDAGMGSSAMGATKFRNRIKDLNLGIKVTNTSVDNIPADADIVVCHFNLAERAKSSSPNSDLVCIQNFLQDPNLDELYNKLAEKKNSGAASTEAVKEEEKQPSAEQNASIFNANNIILGLTPESKEDAIRRAGELLVKQGYVENAYVDAMLEREKIVTTYIGSNVAIPHGTGDAKEAVKKSGIVLLQYPDGVEFGDEKAYLVVGIAGVGDEHLSLLAQIATMIDDENKLKMLTTTTDKEAILKAFEEE